MVLKMVATENTWSHQRRKRRQKLRSGEDGAKQSRDDGDSHPESPKKENTASENHDNTKSADMGSTDNNVEEMEVDSEKKSPEKTEKQGDNSSMSPSKMEMMDISIEDVEEYLIKCSISVKKDSDDILLEIVAEGGENRENLHQIMQYFKNKLK